MDDKELEFIYKYMTPQQKKEFLQTIKNYELAMNINDDTEFLKNTFNELFKKYPFLKAYIENNTQKTSPKRT